MVLRAREEEDALRHGLLVLDNNLSFFYMVCPWPCFNNDISIKAVSHLPELEGNEAAPKRR